MAKSLTNNIFTFTGQTDLYNGKVRDVYTINEDLLVVIASDRISAFDHILPKGIPFKGQVLNQIAAMFLKDSKDICPNWLIDTPDPSVSIGHKCEPIRIEMVIRGYLAGHAAREYSIGKRELCGVKIPEGLKENDKFEYPIITPAAKALEGHDEDISKKEILRQNLVSKDIYETMEKYTYKLFERGSKLAEDKGLILVDTKYEFGLLNGEVVLIDEIHTPDSSRYFYLEGYHQKQMRGEPQKQLSKEFVREWLIDRGFQGKDGQSIPEMPDSFVNTISDRYIELFEKITGNKFHRGDSEDIEKRIHENVENYLIKLK